MLFFHRIRPRLFLLCAALAWLTAAGASCAKADLLLFAAAEDCLAAPVSEWKAESPHAAVLQRAGAGEEKAARDALSAAGVAETEFLGFPGIKAAARTAETMEKRWATKENTARVVSLLRKWKDEKIIYYSSGEEELRFLSSFADACARGAGDPACRRTGKQQPDEYLQEVRTLADGATGEERAATPPDASWRTAWENPSLPDLSALPETDAEGFLPEGEFVLEDADNGLWVYLSRTLRIIVTKHRTDEFSWFEADILRRPEGETLHIVTSLNGRGGNPANVAAENRLVFGINADYYQSRVNNKKRVGLIIRGGKLIRESAGATSGTGLPPLDTLLLDAAGGFRLDKAGEMDSARAFELGAVDVLAFGPVLVKDGRLRVLTVNHHSKKEPRTAVGLLGENHYLAVIAEGRLRKAAGMSLDHLGQLMAARGCTEAINLDGGHTSALIFMGTRLNKIGNLTGTGTSAPRNMSELLGIGTYSR